MPNTCFVIMGFGKKTDYSGEPRTLDLDATFDAIIKPAVDACPDLVCVRADKVLHSGVIDTPMYEMLLNAEIVIADISTANPNAIYELGVRHALRPRSTIIMKEVDGKFHFDLNHLATLQYKHLGDDIGSREAKVKSEELRQLIEAVRAAQANDSPVYTFLPMLKSPALAAERAERASVQVDELAQRIEDGRRCMAAGAWEQARVSFEKACELRDRARAEIVREGKMPGAPDPFVVQQLALATQRTQAPDPVSALRKAWTILEPLEPLTSTDLETLGIGGGIKKRLWAKAGDLADLNAAIELYGRGFEIKRDYYNGENYAVCLDWRGAIQAEPSEADYDRTTARKTRERIIESLSTALVAPSARERGDFRWMLATMANTLRALGRPEADGYEQRFRDVAVAGDLGTFEEGKAAAIKLALARTS